MINVFGWGLFLAIAAIYLRRFWLVYQGDVRRTFVGAIVALLVTYAVLFAALGIIWLSFPVLRQPLEWPSVVYRLLIVPGAWLGNIPWRELWTWLTT